MQSRAVQGFNNETLLHPVGAMATLVLGALLVLAPRRLAMAAPLLLVCFVPVAQRVSLAGLDFHLLRILVLVGWLRVAMRQEWSGFRLRALDWHVVAWTLIGALVYVAQWGDGTAVVYQTGQFIDKLGIYFLCRVLIRDWGDLENLARAFAVVAAVAAGVFLVERTTHRNMFHVFGGVPDVTHAREGRLRCQGPFQHAIIAGVFYASSIPILATLVVRRGRDRMLGVLGVCAAMLVVFCTASSTPVMTVFTFCVGLSFYWARRWMWVVRVGLVCLLFGLHMFMKGPVWSLLGRVNIFSGSTGWHRFNLMDTGIERFGEWWLLGVRSSAGWGHQLHDITNQYLLEGMRGGLITLLAFIAILICAFGGLGRLRQLEEGDRTRRFQVWILGSGLFAHVVTFFSLSYFAQMIFAWFLTLAIIGSLSPTRQEVARRPRTVERGRLQGPGKRAVAVG